MELILIVNLAFSIVGFFFIFRMWKEVKSRRDEYGENWTIPKGESRGESSPVASDSMSMEQLTALVLAQMDRDHKPEPEPEPTYTEGDLQKLLAAMANQKGA